MIQEEIPGAGCPFAVWLSPSARGERGTGGGIREITHPGERPRGQGSFAPSGCCERWETGAALGGGSVFGKI